MDKSEYLVESPPPPPRKLRRTPVRSRELGVAVVCQNGKFVMPKAALNNGPLVIAICELTVKFYNDTADLKLMKKICECAIHEAEGAELCTLQHMCTLINKQIRVLITLACKYRNYILKVEHGTPVNEPPNWSRR